MHFNNSKLMFVGFTAAVNFPDSGVAPGKARAVNFRFLRVMVRKDGKVQTHWINSETTQIDGAP